MVEVFVVRGLDGVAALRFDLLGGRGLDGAAALSVDLLGDMEFG